MWRFLSIALCMQYGLCALWPKGVVHYAINAKHYDVHSQDVILATFSKIEKEICVKFFNMPTKFNSSAAGTKILYINNPQKRKDCPPDVYNFKNTIIDMPIGYKCINEKSISRIIVDMLRASVDGTKPIINSHDLIRKFQEQLEDHTRPFLINPTDRNFINAHYYSECRSLSERAPVESRRSSGDVSLTKDNEDYYKNKVWPLGVLMYGVEDSLQNTPQHLKLKQAMTTIELASCVVFQEVQTDDGLKPTNLIWFGGEGAEVPNLGFMKGNQTVSLQNMVTGAEGHTAHTLNSLLRALGLPMGSNRPDRDNHININWNNVEKGKEQYLEKYPVAAWLRDARLPYDFASVTHAPANFACGVCVRGQTTVEPAHDHLWQRVLSMGHNTELSEGDRMILDVLYSEPCRNRYKNNK